VFLPTPDCGNTYYISAAYGILVGFSEKYVELFMWPKERRYIQVDDRNSAQFDGVHVYCGRKTCLECGSSSNTHTCMVDVSPMVWYESIKLLGRVDRMTIVRHSQDDVIRSVR